jgi:hypothetical protein
MDTQPDHDERGQCTKNRPIPSTASAVNHQLKTRQPGAADSHAQKTGNHLSHSAVNRTG